MDDTSSHVWSKSTDTSVNVYVNLLKMINYIVTRKTKGLNVTRGSQMSHISPLL